MNNKIFHFMGFLLFTVWISLLFSCGEDLEGSDSFSIETNQNAVFNDRVLPNPFPIQDHTMMNKKNINIDFDHGDNHELVVDLKKLGIEEEEAQQYFSTITDIGNILKSTGGFYDPQSQNSQQLKINGHPKYYKIVINGSTLKDTYEGDLEEKTTQEWEDAQERVAKTERELKIMKYISNQYRVKEIANAMEITEISDFSEMAMKQKILKAIYGKQQAKVMVKSMEKDMDMDNDQSEEGKMTFHVHSYDTYRKNPNSSMVTGSFMSVKVKGEDTVTVRGALRVDLNSRTHPPLIVYFGSEYFGGGGIVLDENDFAKSGKLIIKYAYTKLGKEYIIDSNLSKQDKSELRELNLFNIA